MDVFSTRLLHILSAIKTSSNGQDVYYNLGRILMVRHERVMFLIDARIKIDPFSSGLPSVVYHFQWAGFKVRSHNLGKLLKAIITNGLDIAL